MTHLTHQRYLKLLFGLFLAVGGGLIALNWRIDPLQFYRKAAYPPLLIGQKRFQVPGLIKHYDYDTVVIGTSVSENFEARDIKKELSLNALNLSMQGASVLEQKLALTLALQTGKVRNVIWDINFEFLRGDAEWVANFDGSFPFYFYDDNPLNEVNNYLLNVDTAKNSLKILLRRCGLNTYRSFTPDELYPWYRKKPSGAAVVRKSWQLAAAKGRKPFLGEVAEYASAKLNANFDRQVLQLIREHPEVKFTLYFPPNSVGYYAQVAAAAPEVFDHMLQSRQHVFAQTRDLPNVRLFDFQPLPELIYETDNYFDLMHFTHPISNYILESMRLDRHRMTAAGSAELKSLVASPRTGEWVKHLAP